MPYPSPLPAAKKYEPGLARAAAVHASASSRSEPRAPVHRRRGRRRRAPLRRQRLTSGRLLRIGGSRPRLTGSRLASPAAASRARSASAASATIASPATPRAASPGSAVIWTSSVPSGDDRRGGSGSTGRRRSRPRERSRRTKLLRDRAHGGQQHPLEGRMVLGEAQPRAAGRRRREHSHPLVLHERDRIVPAARLVDLGSRNQAWPLSGGEAPCDLADELGVRAARPPTLRAMRRA